MKLYALIMAANFHKGLGSRIFVSNTPKFNLFQTKEIFTLHLDATLDSVNQKANLLYS